MNKNTLFLPLLIALLAACSAQPYRDGAPGHHVDVSQIPDAVPRHEPLSRYGNPASYEQFGQVYYPMRDARGFVERGIASWYGTKFHGRRTSSGEDYNMYSMTAAHKTLPLPSYVEVTNLDNGRRVIVKVNDRGPFHEGRIIDLSYAAAIKLGVNKTGTGRVEIRVIDPDAGKPDQPPPALTVQALEPPSPGSMLAVPIQTQQATARPLASPGMDAPRMYLQVGAFSSLDGAEKLRRRLDSNTRVPVHVLPGKTPERTIYRVRVGPVYGEQQARQLAATLAEQGVNNSHLIVD